MSEGYLRGKIVVVDRWGVRCPPCRALLPRLEILWQSFRDRPFVLIGGHCQGWGTPEMVKRLAAKNGLTYPIYEEACLAREPRFTSIPFLYVVDPAGQVLYAGNDEREATDTVVSAVADLEDPASEARWRYHLDVELQILPARALRRYRDFKKKFPAAAGDYADAVAALLKIPDIDKLVKLVETVRKVRDFSPRDENERRKLKVRLDETIAKYDVLKDHSDPRVVQEAKNALADLEWMKGE